MRVSYKGKLDTLVPAQRKKLEAKLDRLAKVVDGREEREAHFVLTNDRHVHNAELTVSIRDHVVVGVGSSPDLLTAMTGAVEKLEKQVRKLRAKWRDTKRGPEKSLKAKPVEEPGTAVAPEPDETEEAGPQVFRANHRAEKKPLTLEEAMLEMEDGRDYLVYRDTESDHLCVLLRRRDGHFDLVEA